MIRINRKIKFLLATLLLISFIGAVYGATIWIAQQTITQTIEGAVSGTAIQTLALPTGYNSTYGNHTFQNAVILTTKAANLKFCINQTEEQKNNIASMYSLFKLHVRRAGTATDLLVIDLRTETYAYTILPTAGTYSFDYFIEYCPIQIGSVSYVITVSVIS